MRVIVETKDRHAVSDSSPFMTVEKARRLIGRPALIGNVMGVIEKIVVDDGRDVAGGIVDWPSFEITVRTQPEEGRGAV